MSSIDSSHEPSTVACGHCHGTTEHEPWCITRDPQVFYAYQIVAEASKLSFADRLILHSLGVTWSDLHA
jgi:hypothetical protein